MCLKFNNKFVIKKNNLFFFTLINNINYTLTIIIFIY